MNYIKLEHESVISGDGLRVVLWLSGCNHNCFKCQNPQTWDCNSGIPFDQVAHNELFKQLSKKYISGITLTGGDPLHENNIDEVLCLVTKIKNKNTDILHVGGKENIKHNIMYCETDEITLSYPNKSIWLYTGYTWNQIMHPIVTDDYNPIRNELLQKRREIVKQCDILIDGRYVDGLRDITLKWRGSSNQRVIDIQESLIQDKVILHCE